MTDADSSPGNEAPGKDALRERVLEHAMRLANVGSWVWYAHDGSIRWSDQMYEIAGVDRDVVPSAEFFYSLIHDDDRERVMGIGSRGMETGYAPPHEYRLVRPCDGAVRYVQTSGEVLLDENGKMAGYVGATLDLTERRAVEERLREGQRLEAVGRLAGGIAHDFNNLLTVILSSVDLLKRETGTLPGPMRDIQEAAQRGAHLTGQVLAFARRQLASPRVVELNEIVAGVSRLLAPVVPDSVGVELELCDRNPRIRMDRGQLEQVLISLGVNALDAMPNGGRMTLVTDVVSDPAGARARIGVRDTGVGIPADVRPHLFEPFFSTKPPGEGTGLGLATCHGIVTQHGGSIAYETAVGKGTAFVVEFPATDAPLEEDGTVAGAGGPAVETDEVQILIVEDEPAVRGLCKKILERAGYAVEAVGSLAELRDWLGGATLRPALVLTDWSLPDGNGHDVAQALKGHVAAGRILFSSGYTAGGLGEDGELDPDVNFLPKPFDPDQLVSAVATILAGGKARPPR